MAAQSNAKIRFAPICKQLSRTIFEEQQATETAFTLTPYDNKAHRMWPQALQMTRDECRGVLRRLELESYSQVISVFRAQGGLNDNKAKLLEDLRGIFHISQDRHRAEARRVANDEQLSAIAETISGPNTWQEWSREGRRSFPMLPRVAPQTALALIANSVASEAVADNAKLPYPAETAAAIVDEQAANAMARSAIINAWDAERSSYVVSGDPFKMPDIPSGPRKNLKRNISDHQTGSNKKRTVKEVSPSKLQQQKQFQHITANMNASELPASNIGKLYNNHSKLQQQRFFHQQQMQKQKQKTTVKKATSKRQATPAKSGRRALKLQQQQQQQQQEQLQQQADQRNFVHATDSLYAAALRDELRERPPRIAASKKDITKNLTKLQIPTTAHRIATFEHHGTSSNLPGAGTLICGKTEKQLISTPVQKYIVEDRQPPPPTPQTSSASAPQIMTLPQLSAAATKLRTINTSILPPGTKLMTRRMSRAIVDGSSTISSQHQLFNIVEGVPIASVVQSGAAKATHSTTNAPTHTVPAVMQLQSSGGIENAPAQQQPSQGKVLTTKLLPIVLSANAATTNITKFETINNGATLVGGGNTSSGTAIIKNLPSTLLLGSQSSTSGTISCLGTSQVFRKSPSIIKAGIVGLSAAQGAGLASIGMSPAKISSNFTSHHTGPQIISNVKISPAIHTTPITTTHQQQHQFFQHQIKNVPSTGLRTSVKICQSPNGKVFIKSDPKFPGRLQQRLLSTSFIGATTVGSATTTTSTPSQRIAIQKVQIIPAPSSSPSGSSVVVQQKHTALGIASKSNMIFMPTTAQTSEASLRLNRGNVSIKNASLQAAEIGAKPNVVVIGTNTNMQLAHDGKNTAAFTVENKKCAPTSTAILGKNNNQMITEDTPVDILNMPVDVDGDGKDVTANNNMLTVLSSNLIETATQRKSTEQQSSTVNLGATDWEMELDQATAATKAHTADRYSGPAIGRQLKSFDEHQQTEVQSAIDTIVLDDSFEDVIVEEHEEGTDAMTTIANDNIIMLIDNDKHTKNIEECSSIAINDHNLSTESARLRQQQLRQTFVHSSECETDAGFDETIDADEIEENAAIEYIEDDEKIETNQDPYVVVSPNQQDATTSSKIAVETIKKDQNNTINAFLSTMTDESNEAAGPYGVIAQEYHTVADAVSNNFQQQFAG